MSKGNGWVPIDKMLAQDFKYIKRPLSRIEAMFSYTVDVDNGITGTIAGYATQWGWSRNKVRRFVNCIGTEEGHLKDSRRTAEGHPIRFIDNGLWSKKDSKGTEEGQKKDRRRDATIEPNPNPNPKDTPLPPKKKKTKKFEPPTESETIQFFIENGFTEQSARKAWAYYQDGNWKDSRGNQVKNWKQKMRGVWFKDENKSPLNGTPRKTPEQIEAEKREALS